MLFPRSWQPVAPPVGDPATTQVQPECIREQGSKCRHITRSCARMPLQAEVASAADTDRQRCSMLARATRVRVLQPNRGAQQPRRYRRRHSGATGGVVPRAHGRRARGRPEAAHVMAALGHAHTHLQAVCAVVVWR